MNTKIFSMILILLGVYTSISNSQIQASTCLFLKSAQFLRNPVFKHILRPVYLGKVADIHTTKFLAFPPNNKLGSCNLIKAREIIENQDIFDNFTQLKELFAEVKRYDQQLPVVLSENAVKTGADPSIFLFGGSYTYLNILALDFARHGLSVLPKDGTNSEFILGLRSDFTQIIEAEKIRGEYEANDLLSQFISSVASSEEIATLVEETGDKEWLRKLEKVLEQQNAVYNDRQYNNEY